MVLVERIQLIRSAGLGAVAPGLIFALMAMASERISVWWSLPFGLATGILTAWAVTTFFGIGQLEQLAAHAAHGGRHYYFEQQEIRVLFDDEGAAWIRLSDLRECIGGDASEIRHYGPTEATLIAGEGRQPYLSVAGVRRYLKVVRHADKARFALWFERDFVAPLERRRERNLPLHSTGQGRL